MDNIKSIIGNVIKDLSNRQSKESDKLERVLKSILTKEEIEHIKILGEKDGKVNINIDSPAWNYQFRTKKRYILERIKDEMPRVKELQFRVGKIK
jgi:hypothetical protein